MVVSEVTASWPQTPWPHSQVYIAPKGPGRAERAQDRGGNEWWFLVPGGNWGLPPQSAALLRTPVLQAPETAPGKHISSWEAHRWVWRLELPQPSSPGQQGQD